MILLSDEEVEKLVQSFDYSGPHWWRREFPKMNKAQLKKVGEWGNGECEHYPGSWGGEPNTRRRECDLCWLALLKEIE